MSIKVDLFSGFLGAGKTKLIKKLIEEGYYKEKIAIIENEFGEVSIDGEILKRTNTIVKEINAGCICCQVTGDFKSSIIDIIENYDMERLIIEPTGVAKLSEVKDILNEKQFEGLIEVDRVITIVDAEKYNLYLSNFRSFFVDQIKSAEFILLSRYQNIDKEDANKLESSIEKLNTSAYIVGKDWDKTSCQELLPNFKLKKNISINKKDIFEKLSKRNMKIQRNDKASDSFESFALSITKQFTKEELISKFNFLGKNEGYGEIVRAKGIVKVKSGEMQQFDYTLSEINMEDIKYSGKGVISFIGTNLNKEEIIKFFI